jgi:hypothetical protein
MPGVCTGGKRRHDTCVTADYVVHTFRKPYTEMYLFPHA